MDESAYQFIGSKIEADELIGKLNNFNGFVYCTPVERIDVRRKTTKLLAHLNL